MNKRKTREKSFLKNDKRHHLRRGGFYFIFLLLLWGSASAQREDYNVVSDWLEYTDAPNALYHYLAGQAYAQLQKRDSMVSTLQTQSEWQTRQKQIKATLAEIIGPFPEKTPLNAVVTRKIQKEDYSIEHIIFESQPGFYVTSSLFIPDNIQEKAPAVLDCIGHTDISYRSPSYQKVILNLVKKGFVVLVMDPVGQGERIQYGDSDTAASMINGPVSEHAYPGVQAFLTGNSQAKYMIWDGIRAIDYLLDRKEVDSARIGITGISGGGTQTAYIAALDDRIYAAAPENYITTFKRLLQAIGPQDPEQNLMSEIINGIDHPDFLEVRAPKPAMMVTTTRDFFPIQGSIEAAEEISKVYNAYGKNENFHRAEDDTTHAFSKKNREAINAFFQRHLDNSGDSTDLEVEVLSKEELRVTKTGQVYTSFPNAETVFSLNEKDAEKAVGHLKQLRQSLSDFLPKALKSAERLSGYREPKEYHSPVFTGRYQKKGYTIEKYFVKGEGAYVVPYLIFKPDTPNGSALICLNPKGKTEEVSKEEVRWFVKQGFSVMIPDLIGVGEMGPGRYYKTSERYYGMFSLSVLIGRSIVGIRAGDVNRLTKILKEEYAAKAVYGLAREEMTSVLLHAAAFNKDISHIMLFSPLSSYRSIVMNRFYKPSFIYEAVAGALKSYDLPDLAASLAPRKLTIVNRVDGKGEEINENAVEDIGIIKAAYKTNGMDKQLNILYKQNVNDLISVYRNWIADID